MNPNPNSTAIETVGGRRIDFAAPDPAEINVEDIVHGLANTCRFAGQSRHYYSVANHAVLVHDIVAEIATPELAKAALHHDDHEAYVSDLPTPLKLVLGWEYRAVVRRLDRAIGEALDIDPALFHDPFVVAADQLAMQLEARQLMPGDWAWRDEDEPVLPRGVIWSHVTPSDVARWQYRERAYRLALKAAI